MTKLSAPEIRTAQKSIPQWTRRGSVLRRTFKFTDFLVAMKFVNAVARAAERAQHHPDIDVRWNRVTLALTTHDAGGLTAKDFALAAKADALAGKLG
jgi:4a-hydroxytetrahydrobiopterin dehydratase